MTRPLRSVGPALLASILAALLATPSHANLIVNGSFETGPAPGSSMMLSAGSTAISGWMVTRTNIDYCGTIWTAAEGACSIGLNGLSPGGIAQTFATQPGAQYSVRFFMAGDPGTTPVIKTLTAAAAGQSADFTVDITGMWAWDPGWNPRMWTFTAVSSSTTLEFSSDDAGDVGPALDSVTVERVATAAVGPQAGALALAPPAPNPALEASRIEFTLPEATPVRLSVFDLAGRAVAVLADGVLPAGRHDVVWDGRDGNARAPAGVYVVELRAAGERRVQRLALLR
jgi:choice-of-anchor C domain-containing protein